MSHDVCVREENEMRRQEKTAEIFNFYSWLDMPLVPIHFLFCFSVLHNLSRLVHGSSVGKIHFVFEALKVDDK